MPFHIIKNLAKLDFEVTKCDRFVFSLYFLLVQAKKDVAQIFNNILRRQIGVRSPTVEYICTKSEILFMLVKG